MILLANGANQEIGCRCDVVTTYAELGVGIGCQCDVVERQPQRHALIDANLYFESPESTISVIGKRFITLNIFYQINPSFMQQKNFVITELRIQPDCEKLYRKVLKEESYKFNQLNLFESTGKDLLEQELFGNRIFIQTVVGKNGSGKSSILEIIYRIINNYAYFILKYTKPKRTAAEPIYLIEGIYADLDFIIDNAKNTIKVRDKTLAVIHDDQKVYFGEFRDEFSEFADYNKETKENIIKIASAFFYTIVTNYSLQSLISSDFANDIAKDFVGSKSIGIASNGNWLDSLFHKNDGYITPIVLNPYRENGVIDLQREYLLTVGRIAALLVEFKRSKRELLDGYKLSTIKYSATSSHFLGRLFRKFDEKDTSTNLLKILAALGDKGSLANEIMVGFGLSYPKIDRESDIIPYAYLIYKTLNIIDKYPQFEEYKDVPHMTAFNVILDDATRQFIHRAITEIKRNKSHVGIKIFQTLNYLGAYKSLMQAFSLEEYIPYKEKRKFKNIDDIIEHLPPPFYEQDIKLLRTNNLNSELSLSALSSGERQFAYTISTIVYHIKNLLSIQHPSRIRYRNINVILDEVEICFHPEYQRQFVDRLLNLIKRLNLTRNCSLNIIIVTHSPFILSDIPKRNILFLEEGKQYEDEKLINPFAANINDILYQSFFLSGGFTGEHAKNQINSAVNVLERISKNQRVSNVKFWNEERLRQLINLIGEPLVRDNLLLLHTQAFNTKSLEQIILEKDAEIARLNKVLNNQS